MEITKPRDALGQRLNCRYLALQTSDSSKGPLRAAEREISTTSPVVGDGQSRRSNHGGGTDAIAVHRGSIIVSASIPSNPAGVAAYRVTRGGAGAYLTRVVDDSEVATSAVTATAGQSAGSKPPTNRTGRLAIRRVGSIQQVISRAPSIMKLAIVPTRPLPSSIARMSTLESRRMLS